MMIQLLNRLKFGDQRSIIVKKNIFWSLIIKSISIIISLLLVPITLGYLNSELYGIWLTLSSIIVWFQFLDIGFTLGLKNKLAESIAKQEWEKGKSLVSTTYITMICIFVPLCIILCIINPHVNWSELLNTKCDYNNEIIKVVYILICILCIQMIVNVISSVVSAFQNVALSSSFTVIGNFLSLIGIYILTKTATPSLVSLSLILSTMPVVVLIMASIILYNSKYKLVCPTINKFDFKLVKEIFGLGYKFFLIQIQIIVLYQSTNLLISNISGPEFVTSYNIAYKYLSVLMMVFNIIVSPLWPAFTDAYVKKDYNWMNRIYKKMIKLSMITSFGVILLVTISPFVYRIWIGDKTIIPLSMTLIVALYVIIHIWDSLQVQIINGVGAIKLQTYVTLIGIICHVPLSFWIGKYLGGIGVVVSMCLINLIYSTIFTIQTNKILKQKASKIWIQ